MYAHLDHYHHHYYYYLQFSSPATQHYITLYFIHHYNVLLLLFDMRAQELSMSTKADREAQRQRYKMRFCNL